MNGDPLDHQLVEIEQDLLRDDPTLDRQFAALDPVYRWHDATIFMLFAASAVSLAIGLATMSIAAWLAGAMSAVTAFTIDARHERELEETRRAIELGLPHRSRRFSTHPVDSRSAMIESAYEAVLEPSSSRVGVRDGAGE